MNTLVQAVCNNKVLVCPRCLCEWMHQTRVEVYDRQEDAQMGTLAIVQGEQCASLETFTLMTACPSARRGGVRIWFWCEGCEEYTALVVIQHKGATFVGWEMPVLPNRLSAPVPPAEPSKVVYFIGLDGDAGLVKIGVSKHPEKRLAQLQQHAPTTLRILATEPGGHEREGELHKRFAHLRTRGEWFWLRDELADYIGEVSGR